jgi:hypothetical protein
MIFNENNVRTEWDDSLEGKEGYLADATDVLKRIIINEDKLAFDKVRYSNNPDYQFKAGCDSICRYFYPVPEIPKITENKDTTDGVITKIKFEGIQIKSEEIFHRFCKSMAEIEELCGIHEVEITLENIFFCPWIDMENCRKTPMEVMIIELVKQLDTDGQSKNG